MSKKAEQKTLETYPKEENGTIWTATFGEIEIDKCAIERKAFQNGYELAEKDLALTWEDIAKIDALILEANKGFAVDYSKEIREQFYTEVLDRFNKNKEKK